MREIFEDSPVLGSIAALIIVFIIFVSIDAIFSKRVYFSGVVVDKHYKAKSTRTGSGVVSTGNGQTGVVVTSESEPEEFLVMVKVGNGKVFTVECEPEIYYSKNNGYTIDCYWSKGCITGWQWGVHGIK